MILTLGPLVGAIAAGCCAVIKPSEVAPHFAELLLDLLPKYVDDSAYRVITGSVPEITALLDLQWDMSEPGLRFLSHLIPASRKLLTSPPSSLTPHLASLLHGQRTRGKHRSQSCGKVRYALHTRAGIQMPGHHRRQNYP